MPNTKSAEKRLRQNKKRRMRNRITKKVLKTFSKRSVSAAAEGKTESAESDFRLATAKIDRAGAHRVLHPNTANRRKSKLARDYAAALNKADAKSPSAS